MSGTPLTIQDLAEMAGEAAVVNSLGGELAVRVAPCITCGAQPGEVCRSGGKPSSSIHANRRDTAFWRLSEPLSGRGRGAA